MKRITVDVPDDLYERLRLLAFQAHSNVSQVVRDRLAWSLRSDELFPGVWMRHKDGDPANSDPSNLELTDAPKESGR